MKKTFVMLSTAVMMTMLAACGGSKPAETTAAETAAEETTAEETAAEESAEETEAEAEESSVGLQILYEQDDSMINTYSLLAVNPEAPFVDADEKPVEGVELNTEGAKALINWMLSEIPEATEETKKIRLSTTTSVNDSGLLGYLLPMFEEKYGYEVEVYSAGTGKAIANAKMGNADLILVHSKKQEEAFIEDGFSYVIDGMDAERLSFMYNYFVLCGPAEDPVGARDCATVKDAFAKIAEEKQPFVSRGDGSGTHTKELSLWPEDLGITEEAASFADYTDWYTSANAGMGVCLTMANEMGAYILSDKATFLTFRANNGVME